MCPICKKSGSSTRSIGIQRVPPILLLHLSRFEYTTTAKKQEDYVDFPLQDLNLLEHMVNPTNLATFDLVAVINHYGNMNSGHYTSYCKPPRGEVWYECNDSVVSEL